MYEYATAFIIYQEALMKGKFDEFNELVCKFNSLYKAYMGNAVEIIIQQK